MLKQSMSGISEDIPVLRLGLAGFTTSEQASLTTAMALRAARGQIVWQAAALGEADAWCVNGSRVQRLPDGSLRIVPGLPSGRSIRISPADIDWPMAFSTPLGSPEFRPACAFQLEDPGSIDSMLQQLESWLRPLRVQFYLASQVVEEGLNLHSGVFHVNVKGKLYAVVGRRSGIGVLPDAEPADLRKGVWSHRSERTEPVPGHFVRTDFSELMWQYATRTLRDCLPPHYRTRRLFLRRPPRVPMRLLSDPSLLLVRELASGPASIAELAQCTGMADPQLSRHLGALYMVGAITADPRRAPAPQPVAVRPGVDWSSFRSSAGAGAHAVPEMTVKLTVSPKGRAPLA
jgi:DNA-binding transcriptional ArsR family regulator